MARYKDRDWDFGNDITWAQVPIAVLMDIRDELQTLNRLLACSNFTGIPHTLRSIQKNTTKPRKKRKSNP